MKFLFHVNKVLHGVIKVSYWISMCVLFFIMMVISFDVMGRYFLNRPMMGAFEIVELGMVIVVSLGLAYTAVEKRHVTVDVLISHFPVKVQCILERIMSLLGALFFLMMGWQLGVRIWEGNIRMVGIYSISEAPFMFAATLGCLTLCIVLLQNVSRTGKRG